MISDDGKDDWFDSEAGWLEDMASLAFAAILIVSVSLVVGLGFWLAGWL